MTSTDLYDKLHEKGLFLASAPFFFDWVEVHLHANQIDRANMILGLVSYIYIDSEYIVVVLETHQ